MPPKYSKKNKVAPSTSTDQMNLTNAKNAKTKNSKQGVSAQKKNQKTKSPSCSSSSRSKSISSSCSIIELTHEEIEISSSQI